MRATRWLLILWLLTACRREPLPERLPPTRPAKPTATQTQSTTSPTQRASSYTATRQAPTRAATVTAAPTAQAESAPAPTPLPAGLNPLTGEMVDDPLILQRRPLAIKISNAARVRPQYGVNNADLVFEHVSEGGITRFTAVFYGKDASRVGSIRSARLIDLEIPLMYDAAFAYSGSSTPIKSMIRASSFFPRVISPDFEHQGFYRDGEAGARIEDTMFTDTYVLRAVLQQRGQDVAPRLAGYMTFSADLPSGAEAVSSVEVRYGSTIAYWHFDAGSGRYRRWSDGVRHMDALSGEQLSFRNIVIIQAHHRPTDIIEDSLDSRSLQIQIWGQGPMVLHRDGHRYIGQWRRRAPGLPLTFHFDDGQRLPLAPGKSFIHIMPLD